MLLGQDCNGVGSNLVGHVAISGDAVCAHNYRVNLALLHHRARHAVRDNGGGNTVLVQLPSREARALKERTSLIGKDANLLALLNGGANHAQRGAVSTGSQRAGVAVRQHATARGHQHCAMLSHGLIGSDIF